jgi:NAD(P)-dependent dehydrogenase (short-subunit alcohol dehydrogenase family)
MSFSVTDKNIMVTGGTAGIGFAVAKHFAEQGANVVISGRRANGADIAASIGCHFIQTDMTVERDIDNLFVGAVEHFGGKLDTVVNNAGIGPDTGTIAEAHMDAHDLTVLVNMRAAFQVMKCAANYLNDGGAIINTASVSGMEGEVGLASYCATKAALISLTASAALELAPRKIRVNAISPGPFKSEIWEGEDPVEFSKIRIPLGQIGEVEDIVGAYQFMASPASRYITGTNLPVDGGYMAGMPIQISDLINKAL